MGAIDHATKDASNPQEPAVPESDPVTQPVDDATYMIDLGYGGKEQVSASYLLVDRHPTLVETGASPSLPRLEAGVREAGLTMEDVRYVAVTHIHLDHAGGVGALLARYPHLIVYVHPAGARHLADPSRLLRSAQRVFRERLEPLFGRIVPTPGDRIRVLADGEAIDCGRRSLIALDTPGHASHHFVFHEPGRDWVYTGDVAGIRLPGADFVLPPTPPPDIDIAAWQTSLQRIRSLAPKRLLYTHCGWVDDALHWLDEVERELQARVLAVKRGLDAGWDTPRIIRAFAEQFEAPLLTRLGPSLASRYHLAADATMNVEGLVRYWTKQRESSP